ncbi:hypothetical protein RFI_33585 [Reticulomyxa filosa]|uniref:Uncharacterized protein n=1 Tax=Reticulomyxa filosa TaxID=46433 RepID=X6LRR0_RETFI|nr:hypothetical protein RFI_33585 [Reticulomyxa filosa]|eukprot:ETO03817.1 hypothetical protein RFI_33585 [Reticulomyxa filosa]
MNDIDETIKSRNCRKESETNKGVPSNRQVDIKWQSNKRANIETSDTQMESFSWLSLPSKTLKSEHREMGSSNLGQEQKCVVNCRPSPDSETHSMSSKVSLEMDIAMWRVHIASESESKSMKEIHTHEQEEQERGRQCNFIGDATCRSQDKQDIVAGSNIEQREENQNIAKSSNFDRIVTDTDSMRFEKAVKNCI